MKYSRTYTHLGIAGALLIPTLAVAAVDIPNVFEAGDPVSASEMNENFDSVATVVDELEASVGALEARVAALEGAGLQARTPISRLQAEMPDQVFVYQVFSDGIMSVAPIGAGGESTALTFEVGFDFDAAAGKVVCDPAVTCTMARSRQGESAAVFVPAGHFVALTARNFTDNARADVNWQPLRGPESKPPTFKTTLPAD